MGEWEREGLGTIEEWLCKIYLCFDGMGMGSEMITPPVMVQRFSMAGEGPVIRIIQLVPNTLS